MPISPGVRPDIMHDHAGTVIGGTTLWSGPHILRFMSDLNVGRSEANLSKTSSGGTESRPIMARRDEFLIKSLKTPLTYECYIASARLCWIDRSNTSRSNTSQHKFVLILQTQICIDPSNFVCTDPSNFASSYSTQVRHMPRHSRAVMDPIGRASRKCHSGGDGTVTVAALTGCAHVINHLMRRRTPCQDRCTGCPLVTADAGSAAAGSAAD